MLSEERAEVWCSKRNEWGGGGGGEISNNQEASDNMTEEQRSGGTGGRWDGWKRQGRRSESSSAWVLLRRSATHRRSLPSTPQRESLASVRGFLNHRWRLQVLNLRLMHRLSCRRKEDKRHRRRGFSCEILFCVAPLEGTTALRKARLQPNRSLSVLHDATSARLGAASTATAPLPPKHHVPRTPHHTSHQVSNV